MFHFVNMHRRAWSLFLIIVMFSAVGCAGMGSPLMNAMRFGGGGVVPQSQEMAYAPPLKLRIEKCHWTQTINRMEDYDGMYAAMGAMSQMPVKAQDDFLVVEMALTNYGDEARAPVRRSFWTSSSWIFRRACSSRRAASSQRRDASSR